MTPRATRLTRSLRVLALVVPACLLVGCLSVPTSGPVREVDLGADKEGAEGIAFDPRPPRKDATPGEIVSGFLTAMEATPITTTAARDYLTEDFASSWDPSQRTITYVERSTPRGHDDVVVDLTDARWLDKRGAGRGALTGQDAELEFALRKESGEWRIEEAPNAFVVSEAWFDDRYKQVALYYFDPSARVLVPEPVFVPIGNQLATVLVRNLLRGPGARGDKIVRSFLPSGVSEGLSVPVEDGVAKVDLTGSGKQSAQAQQLMAAQLAWTLRQDTMVERIRLTIDGELVSFAKGIDTFSDNYGMEYDPAGYSADTAMYGIHDGKVVVSDDGEDFEPVAGQWSQEHDVTSLSVSPSAKLAAAVTGDRRGILVGQLGPQAEVATSSLTGTQLLRPAWDLFNRVWVVDRAGGDARVSYESDNGAVVSVKIPGITGEDVRRFLVARDGTRFVALIRGSSADRVVVSRLRTTADGKVTGGTKAVRMSLPYEGPVHIKDIAWNSPTSVVALQGLADTSLVHELSVDAAMSVYPSDAMTVPTKASQLIGSPVVPGTLLYARSGRTLLDPSGAESDATIEDGVSSVGYAG